MKLANHGSFQCFILAGTGQLLFNQPMGNLSATSDASEAEYHQLTHEELMGRVAQHKDKAAFICLFEHFAPRVKSFLLKSGMSEEQAEDLAQDTMLSVWRKAESYKSNMASVSTWIFTIARNRRIDVLRKISPPTFDPSDPIMENLVSDNEQPIDHLNFTQEKNMLVEAFRILPEEQAELIKKSFFEDKTHQAIAEELKIPLGTVKSRIRLGLERLRKSLQENIDRGGVA